LLSSAGNIPEEYQHIQEAITSEQRRLLNFVECVEANRDTSIFHNTDSEQQAFRILEQQMNLVQMSRLVDDAYQPLNNPLTNVDTSTSEQPYDGARVLGSKSTRSRTLLQKSLSLVSRKRTHSPQTSRDRFDKERTEKLIRKMADMNDSLRDLLEPQHRQRLEEMQKSPENQTVPIERQDVFSSSLFQNSPSPSSRSSFASGSHQSTLSHMIIGGPPLPSITTGNTLKNDSDDVKTIASHHTARLNFPRCVIPV
jgi:hypothetical protein